MNQPLYVIEHWALAEPDAGRQHLIRSGHDVRVVEPWRGDALPELTGHETGVMVMGGPQMVTDIARHRYLSGECRLIEQAMNKGVLLVGVCLGSQLMAHTLGASIDYLRDGHIAMGYFDLTPTAAGQSVFPEPLKTLNGNQQGWTVPSGATMLAHGERDLSPNQAFRVGEKAIGLQFHPEVTRAILDQWQAEFADALNRPGAQSKAEQDYGFAAHDPALKAWYYAFLDEWFGNPSGGSAAHAQRAT